VAAVGLAAGLGYGGWPQADLGIELAGLMLAAIVAAALAVRPAVSSDWTLTPPFFVVVMTTMLLLGRDAALLIATGAVGMATLNDSQPSRRRWSIVEQTGRVLAATFAAGFAHLLLGGTLGGFVWPFQALPIAAAVVAYCVVACAIAEVALPLLTKQPLGRSCHHRLIEGLPNYVIGAAIAVAVAEIIDRGAWTIAPIAVVPLFFLYRAHSASVARVNDEQRRREVVESVEQGMVVVDRTGRITLWDEALDSILGCPRHQALGRSLLEVVPALAKSVVPRTMQDVVSSGNAKAVAPVVAGTRMLEVRILPVSGGVTLLCRDITQRVQAEQAAKKNEARLALAAEGANDGLWEWDLRTQELFVSGRWKAMIGLPATAGTGPVEDWSSRVHPEDTAALKEALEAHIAGRSEHFQNEHRIRHEDGNYRRFLCRGIAVRNASRRAGRIAGSLTDITERAIAQEQLRTAGVLDPLTGLSNRAEFVEELRRRLEHFKEHPSGNRFAALYLDLDRFKIVNDSLGHLVGDELLKAVSRRLESCLREGDALARLGGDEFAILLNGLVEEQQANAIAFRIQKSLGAPFSIGGREVFTSASIGIAFGRTQYNSPDEIMRDADRAMYHAKASGKARHELFDADMHARSLDRIGLESDLRHAVANDAFELHYQPIVLLGSGMCVGFESLIRWTRNGEPISPATFIPMAEELGLIEPVGTWCLQQACSNFADWKRRFPNGALEYITVNVSSRQLVQQNFLALVERTVQDAGMKPSELRLEITETALMDSPTAAAGLLRELREFGAKIYLDDFGTGYSSLSHLHKLPVDALKIDRSFVKSLGLPDRPAIVESILALARTMNTSVVAEGIETEVQAQELERLGCTHAQGFLFSRPIPAAAAEKLLAANQPLIPNKPRAVLEFDTKMAIPA
jgi:diguanylate cyclase (GGDEF)-like protein/PAS domain S-box-containing protein